MSIRVPAPERPYIAAFLIGQRAARGWSQDVAVEHLVAADIGVKPGSYPSWETGARKPPPGVLGRIAAFYGVDMPVEPSPRLPPLSVSDGLVAALIAAIDRQTEALLGRFEKLELGQAATLQILGIVQGRVEASLGPATGQSGSTPRGSRRRPRSPQPGSGGKP